MDKCKEHPRFRGYRFGKSIRDCPICLLLYEARKKNGDKETRAKRKKVPGVVTVVEDEGTKTT